MDQSASTHTADKVHTFDEVPTFDEVLARTTLPPCTLESFRDFAAEKHCQESLDFMAAVRSYDQEYQHLSQSSGGLRVDGSGKPLFDEWQELFHIYIKPYAPREINLTGKIRSKLLSEFVHDHVVLPSPSLFIPAVEHLSDLMRGVFVQWISSIFKAQPSVQQPSKM